MTDTHETLHSAISALMDQGAWLAAIKRAQEGLALVQSDFGLSWDLGWSYFRLQRFEEAALWLHRAVELNPLDPTGHWGLCCALLEAGDNDGAETHGIRALNLRDGYLPRTTLAFLYLSQGRLEEAEQLHVQGLQLRPDSRERLESYADFLYDIGRHEEAVSFYWRAQHAWYESRRQAT